MTELNRFYERGVHSEDLADLEEDEDGWPQASEPAWRIRCILPAPDPRVISAWAEVVHHCKWLRAARRISSLEQSTGAALWTKLARTHADSYGRVVGNPYVGVVADDVKELPTGAPSVAVLEALPGPIAEVVRHEHLMIRPLGVAESEMLASLNARYSQFAGEAPEYPKLLTRPDVVSNRLWEMHFDGEEVATTAILAVGRSKDTQIRKILPTMGFNYLVRRPEEVLDPAYVDIGMMGVGALGTISADPSRGLAWGAIDSVSCFTAGLIMEWAKKYQAGPRIQASKLPSSMWPPGAVSSSWLRPWYTRLGMGSTWSVLLIMWAQLWAVQNALRREPRLATFADHCLNLRRGLLLSHAVTGSTGGFYLHVDDLLVFHELPSLVRAAMRVICSTLRRLGLLLDIKWPGEVVKIIGVALSECGMILTPPLSRLGTLDRGLAVCYDAEFFPPGLLGTMTGIYIYYSLLWRPAMAAPAVLFQWLDTFRGRAWAPMWPSVRREIGHMRACLPFMSMHLGRPVLPALLAQDAAGGDDFDPEDGLGGSFVMAVGFPSPAALSRIWASRETRGAVVGSLAGEPRRSGALGAMDRLIGATTGRTPEWIPVSGIGADAVVAVPWYHILSGRWRWRDHISLGESRPVLMWLSLFFKAGLRGLNLPDMTDNRSTLALYGKGRAAPWRANHLARRRGTAEVYSGNRISASWVSTVWQTADEGTRGEGSESTDKSVYQLHPPIGLVLDFAGLRALCSSDDTCGQWRRYGPSWDLATLRGIGRLAVSIAGGGIEGAVWRLYEVHGVLSVACPAPKHARRPVPGADLGDPTKAEEERHRHADRTDMLAKILGTFGEAFGGQMKDAGEPALLVVINTQTHNKHASSVSHITQHCVQYHHAWLEHFRIFIRAPSKELSGNGVRLCQAVAASAIRELSGASVS
jgi:hypothetical protein